MSRLLLPSLSLVAAALAAQTASAQIGFQAATGVSAPTQPDAVVPVDLDGDGDLDLVAATDAPDKLTLLFNTGGVFGGAQQVFLANGSSPHTPVAGDLDGDGDVDLAVSLKNVNQVQVIVNNGGVFTPGPVFAVGAEPRTLVIADHDGDGDWDLAVSNRSGNSVSVLTNQGALSFAVATVAVGNDPRELAFGDLNGDKRADLAVAVHGDRLVRLVMNTGGGFSAGASLSLGQLRPQGIDTGDLDGDGDVDIAAASSNNGVEFASILLQGRNGTFSGPSNFPLVGLDANSLVLADLDDDGVLDVATANKDSNNVSALRGNGSGGFGAAQLFGVGVDPEFIAAGDLDGNGSADLVTADNTSSTLSVLKNTGSGTPCATVGYCTAKVTSTGSLPHVAPVGVPDVAAGGFSVALHGAVPGKLALGLWGQNGPAAQPFANGLLCVAAPFKRMAPRITDAGGSASTAFPMADSLAGTSAWFQYWFRDSAQPDGTGVGLSDGLRVTFCN